MCANLEIQLKLPSVLNTHKTMLRFGRLFAASRISCGNFSKCKMSSASTASKKLSTIVEKLNEFAPISLGESWDNVGLLIEPYTPKPIERILLTNDVTERVMQEACDKRTDLIISYHPPIFTGMKRVTQSTWKERIVAMCLEKRIALYSPHTTWDSVRGGVTDWLAKAISDAESKVILPGAGTETKTDVGHGRLVELNTPITLTDAIERVKRHTGIKHVHVSIGINSSLTTNIKSYAVCAGAGNSVLKGVVADLYITGEMSHHEVLDAAQNNVNVILCNHSNSERGYLKHFKDILAELLNDSDIQIDVSKVDADPLTTY